MPTFTPDTLREIGCRMFRAAGCGEDDARIVSDHLVESNLFGHDSHGALRFYDYCEGIRNGRYTLDGRPCVVKESGCTAVVDGQGSLGPVGATFAIQLAMTKAAAQGVAVVVLRNTSHIGRVGAYPLIAAREGFIAQLFVNAGHLGYQIAPFGGIDGRLSSNPIAFAAPRRDEPPIMLDMTTCMAAVAKVWVAENKGASLPEGWIIDSEGRPSTDPKDFTTDPRGAMLPLGGAAGHKGYGLAMMMELLGGALSGEGCAAGERKVRSNGVCMTVYSIEQFIEPDRYYDEVESLIQHVRSSRTAAGINEILLPGEMEFANAATKKREGIELDETTWEKIRQEAETHGLDTSRWPEQID